MATDPQSRGKPRGQPDLPEQLEAQIAAVQAEFPRIDPRRLRQLAHDAIDAAYARELADQRTTLALDPDPETL